MSARTDPRTAGYADQFEATQDAFIRLVESLNDDQWRRVGKNYPERLNDEDEMRSVGVIAHHVAASQGLIMDRIDLMLGGGPMPPLNIPAINAAHAAAHAHATKSDVLLLLRNNRSEIARRVRAIADDQLDAEHQTPAGPATVAQRLDRTLCGHIKTHQGSIEAAIA